MSKQTESENTQPVEDTVEDAAGSIQKPRAKTPLEKVREGQAKMRGQSANGGRSSQGGSSNQSNAQKRPLFQRKAG